MLDKMMEDALMKQRDVGVGIISVRPAVPKDLWTVLEKVLRSRYVYLGVGLDRLADHLRQADMLVLDEGAAGYGFVSAVVRPFQVAVITAASVEPERKAAEYLALLLDELEREMRSRNVLSLAQVGYAPWLTNVLRLRGFLPRERIVTFEWFRQEVTPQGDETVEISTACLEDLPQLVEMDRTLFGPVWHKGPWEFSVSFEQAFLFTIAKAKGRIVGYQWCDRVGEHGHLTRLAVDTAWQNQGIGTRLLTDTLRRLVRDGVTLVTLNTQSDNLAASRLYRRHGFMPLDETVDLLWKDL